MTKKISKELRQYLPVLPLLVLLIFVFAYPCISAFFLAFQEISFGEALGKYVGSKNFVGLLKNQAFIDSLTRSFSWAIGNLTIQLTIPMGIALLLNKRIRGINLIRSLIMLPWIVPSVAIAVCMRWMLLPRIGIINELLLSARIIQKPVHFLGSSSTAMLFLIVLNSWKFMPFGTLLILAALQSIPESVFEAAAVDGANGFQQFRYITFPLLGSMIWFVGFLAFAWNFNTFDLIWLTTQGGPGNATQTLPVLIYRTAFKVFRLGEASAISIFIALLLFTIGMLYFKLFTPKSD